MSENALSLHVLAAACTMRNEALLKHYGALQNVTEHYRAIQDVTEHYGTLRECYGALTERYICPMRGVKDCDEYVCLSVCLLT